jgi:threonine/homoserine/homoserine lactone efflux protein
MLDYALTFAVFAVSVASPGPATLMITSTAMNRGRRAAVPLALGIMTGSLFWAVTAAFGSLSAHGSSASLFEVLRFAGGGYLAFLSWKSLRRAVVAPPMAATGPAGAGSHWRNYLAGALLHLTNPKAPLVWLATLSIGANQSSDP